MDSLYIAIPVAALCTIPDSSTTYLSPLAGEIPRHSTTCKVHLGKIRLFLTIFVSNYCMEYRKSGNKKRYILICFFFMKKKRPRLERIRSGSYHPLCYSQDPTDGHAQIGCTFDHWRMQLTATAMIVIFPQSHKFEGASSTDICVSTRCTRNLILSWKEIIRAHIFDLVSEVPPSCTNPTMHSHGALGNTSAALYALCVEPHFNFAS